jgi:hypothetical protein
MGFKVENAVSSRLGQRTKPEMRRKLTALDKQVDEPIATHICRLETLLSSYL